MTNFKPFRPALRTHGLGVQSFNQAGGDSTTNPTKIDFHFLISFHLGLTYISKWCAKKHKHIISLNNINLAPKNSLHNSP